MTFLRCAALSLWAAASCALSLAVAAAPAQAQSFRTWVSSAGNDADVCSVVLPCKTFSGAQSKTYEGGTINCLDAGSYGFITIDQGLTIDCTASFGGILQSGTNGIVINAPGKKVRLRGLELNGGVLGNPGFRGVRIQSASSVTIDDVFIHSHGGPGIEISPASGTVAVFINDSVLADNGNGAAAGIQVVPTGTALVRLSMDGVRILGTTGNALRLDSTGTAGLGILTIIENSTFSNSSGAGISA